MTAYGLHVFPDEPGRDLPAEHPVVPELAPGDEADGVLQRLGRRVHGVRSWFHARPGGGHIWRVGVAVFGLVVIIAGIVMLAAPGPGWLVIFLGLAVWATEFAWAESLLHRTRRTVGVWTRWLGRQPRWLSVLIGAVGLVMLAAAAAGAWLLFGK
jgi:uncharacterized protein (TIGR02611 family)